MGKPYQIENIQAIMLSKHDIHICVQVDNRYTALIEPYRAKHQIIWRNDSVPGNGS
jgi:hypothetical protein